MFPPTPLYRCSVCGRRYEQGPNGDAGAEYRLSRPSDDCHYRAAPGTPEYEQEQLEMQRQRLWIALRAALAQELSDEEVAGLAVEVVEPLVDLFWPSVAVEFEALAARAPVLRRVISGCIFSDGDVDDRLHSIVGAEDELD